MQRLSRTAVGRTSHRWCNVFCIACSLTIQPSVLPQSDSRNRVPDSGSEIRAVNEADSLKAERRAFCVSLVISLATEARSYSDLADRARVLAGSADVLWDADNSVARALFARAWEAAESGDKDAVTVKTKDKPPDMVIALRRMSGEDLRAEVLNLASRRERKLGEQFLAKLKSETEREAGDVKTNQSRDVFSGSEGASRRLQVATKLLNDGQVDQAREFAAPALMEVNSHSINFLSELRKKAPAAADQIFAALLTRTEFDPAADANTVSGLSSYAFTPGFYVVFWSDGPSTWTQPDGPTDAPNLPPGLRDRFFQVGGSVLLRPQAPPDRDYTSCGPMGRLRVIIRVLPLFDQYAPDTATALRAQLTAASRNLDTENPLLTAGVKSGGNPGESMQKIEEQLDHARSSTERDQIYAAAAARLAPSGDRRARDLAGSIADSKLRERVVHYVDFEFVRFAIAKKDTSEVARVAKAGELTHAERAWAYTRAAHLLSASESQRGLDLLQQATDEARHIDSSESDRALVLISIVNELLTADRVRAWEILSEAVKAANSTEEFSGDDAKGPKWSMLVTRSGTRFIRMPAEDFKLSRVFSALAQDELERSVEIAKTFKYDAARANATLAIARAILEKPTTDSPKR